MVAQLVCHYVAPTQCAVPTRSCVMRLHSYASLSGLSTTLSLLSCGSVLLTLQLQSCQVS
jgi:hypothetical protein